MYTFLIGEKEKTKEKHLAKGIKMGASREIWHQQYLEHLQRLAENYLPNHRIGSTLTKIYTIEVEANSCSTCEKHISDCFHNHFKKFSMSI